MKKIVNILLVCLVLVVMAGCMELLPNGETVSKIKTFSASPSTVWEGEGFVINIDAEVGAESTIYILNKSLINPKPQIVFKAKREDFRKEPILVTFETGGRYLKSNTKGWDNATRIPQPSGYWVILEVCDAMVATGNKFCDTRTTDMFFN